MNTSSIKKAFGILLPLLWMCGPQGHAQTDPAAKAVLRQVSATYKGYTTLQASFTLAIQQAQQTDQQAASGTIYMQPATGKYHINTDNQDLISDGKTQWMVLKEEKEVQLTEVDNDSDAISPANIFSFYNNGYKYVAAADERVGNTQLHVVELTPEDTQAPYFKIKLRINKANHLIHDVTVFDKGGTRYSYTIKDTKANPAVAADKFTFKQSAYPGMEIVDLR